MSEAITETVHVDTIKTEVRGDDEALADSFSSTVRFKSNAGELLTILLRTYALLTYVLPRATLRLTDLHTSNLRSTTDPPRPPQL